MDKKPMGIREYTAKAKARLEAKKKHLAGVRAELAKKNTIQYMARIDGFQRAEIERAELALVADVAFYRWKLAGRPMGRNKFRAAYVEAQRALADFRRMEDRKRCEADVLRGEHSHLVLSLGNEIGMTRGRCPFGLPESKQEVK